MAQHGVADAVRFLGRVADDDLAALYAGAELFVSPSLEEGFGFPVLAAMACGSAVACSTAPALVELAGVAARTAEVYPEALDRPPSRWRYQP